jgi:hypothetical protein
MKRFAAVGLLIVTLAAGVPQAQAQQATPSPAPQENLTIIAPRTTREATRARESEFYPGEDIRVRHEPAFVSGMSGAPASGPIKRLGVSAWTSPPGRGDGQMAHETSGWFGFGFSIIWE